MTTLQTTIKCDLLRDEQKEESYSQRILNQIDKELERESAKKAVRDYWLKGFDVRFKDKDTDILEFNYEVSNGKRRDVNFEDMIYAFYYGIANYLKENEFRHYEISVDEIHNELMESKVNCFIETVRDRIEELQFEESEY